jgi:hypothetical protein
MTHKPVNTDALFSAALEAADAANKAAQEHGGYNSAHEALGVLLEEVEEFKLEVFKKGSERLPARMRAELMDIAAVCIKYAAMLSPLTGEIMEAVAAVAEAAQAPAPAPAPAPPAPGPLDPPPGSKSVRVIASCYTNSADPAKSYAKSWAENDLPLMPGRLAKMEVEARQWLEQLLGTNGVQVKGNVAIKVVYYPQTLDELPGLSAGPENDAPPIEEPYEV